MTLGIPDDYDDAQTNDPNNETPVMVTPEGEQTATDEAAAEHRQELAEEIDNLWKGIEANASVISDKPSFTEVKALQERLTAVEQRLTDLEKNHRVMHDHLLEVEKYRGERPEPSAEEIAAINPLVAAVFDDEPECPECGEGNLHMGGPFLGRRVVCSNDTCEFSRQVADL